MPGGGTGPVHTDPVGLDLGALSSWLDGRTPGLLDGPLQARLLAGGRSNLAYEVSSPARSVVVRRPPLGHVLATAHDMVREHRVITALHGTGVPVPGTYAVCADPSVLGAPFYVMEKMSGTAYRLASQLEPLGAQRTRAVCARMVDTLVALHAVDPVPVGLGDFGRPEGFLARQVRRWGAQLAASRSRELVGADELLAQLGRRLPPGSAAGVIHGDYRLDNLLVDEHDRVAAVVDWEMSTLGDPLTDVALLLVYDRLAELDTASAVSDAPSAPGFLTRDEVLERYSAGTGRDLTSIGFYEALACLKLAVVLEGIHYRYVQGDTVGTGFDTVGTLVEPLLARGLAATKEHP